MFAIRDSRRSHIPFSHGIIEPLRFGSTSAHNLSHAKTAGWESVCFQLSSMGAASRAFSDFSRAQLDSRLGVEATCFIPFSLVRGLSPDYQGREASQSEAVTSRCHSASEYYLYLCLLIAEGFLSSGQAERPESKLSSWCH